MDFTLSYKIDTYRRLSIGKDIIELSQWIASLEDINLEIEHFKCIENRILKNSSIAIALQGFRRKNTLVMGSLCKYEQELRQEHEYGKREYDLARAKEHEKRREQYTNLIKEFRELKMAVFVHLAKYQRR